MYSVRVVILSSQSREPSGDSVNNPAESSRDVTKTSGV